MAAAGSPCPVPRSRVDRHQAPRGTDVVGLVEAAGEVDAATGDRQGLHGVVGRRQPTAVQRARRRGEREGVRARLVVDGAHAAHDVHAAVAERDRLGRAGDAVSERPDRPTRRVDAGEAVPGHAPDAGEVTHRVHGVGVRREATDSPVDGGLPVQQRSAVGVDRRQPLAGVGPTAVVGGREVAADVDGAAPVGDRVDRAVELGGTVRRALDGSARVGGQGRLSRDRGGTGDHCRHDDRSEFSDNAHGGHATPYSM